MQKFITIDDKIISFDLNDLGIISVPVRDSFHSRRWEHVRIESGRFILKVTDLRIIKNFIPQDCLRIVDVISKGFTLTVVVKSHTNYATPLFDLEIYEGLHTDRTTWKSIQKLSRCRFDITMDREEYQEWVESLPILPPDNTPHIYQLSGIFDYYQDNSSADCEA